MRYLNQKLLCCIVIVISLKCTCLRLAKNTHRGPHCNKAVYILLTEVVT